MGSFSISNRYTYVLVTVDYIPKWMEVAAYRNNDKKW